MEPTLTQIVAWAKQAGEIARQMQHEDLQIEHKGKADLVTRADKTIETLLLEKILESHPGHNIIAEESGMHAGDQEHRWFVDPIDGTINYAHRLPFYSISIAYAFRNQLELGVIYDPMLNECFSAQRGKGAWLNGEPIHVSNTDQLIDSLLITGFRFHLLESTQTNVNNFVWISQLAQSVRRMGSAALSLAYIGCGRIEGFWEVSLNPWDLAAGMLIVQEAGGVVEKMYGDGDLLAGRTSLLAANPAIFPQLRTVLLEERQKLEGNSALPS